MRGAGSFGTGLAAAFAALLAPHASAQACNASTPPRTITLVPGQNVGELTPGFTPLLLLDHEVVLTFDDGPDPNATPQILDLLKTNCLPATFFLIGRAARDNPELVRRELAEGHAVGGHTEHHSALADMPLKQATRDISNGFAPLIAAGVEPRLFRFPQLQSSPELLAWLKAHGLSAVSADIDPRDWAGDPPEATLARIEAALNEKGRGVILMHDTQANTEKLLPALIAFLGREGYRVVRLTGAKSGGIAG